jgi:hypothetical protein
VFSDDIGETRAFFYKKKYFFWTMVACKFCLGHSGQDGVYVDSPPELVLKMLTSKTTGKPYITYECPNQCKTDNMYNKHGFCNDNAAIRAAIDVGTLPAEAEQCIKVFATSTPAPKPVSNFDAITGVKRKADTEPVQSLSLSDIEKLRGVYVTLSGVYEILKSIVEKK